MIISDEEINKALKIRNAVQKFLVQTQKVNLRSTDVFPYLVRRGLYKEDVRNGLYFRRFLKRLYIANMLKSLIPQCSYVPGINGEIFGEWYFNSFKFAKVQTFDGEEKLNKADCVEKILDLESAKQIILNFLDGLHPLTNEPLADEDDSLNLILRSLQILNKENKELDCDDTKPQKGNIISKKSEKPMKAYTQEEKRRLHKNAYLPWTKEKDELLELFYCNGSTIRELVNKFERNPGAIRSRIKKLELREKYENK